MLYTILLTLAILWMLGAIFGFGGVLIHFLLLVALAVLIIKLIRSEK